MLVGSTTISPVLPAFAYARQFSTWATPSTGTYCLSPTVINNGWTNLVQPSMTSWNNVATYSRPTFNYTACGGHQSIGIAAMANMSACGVTLPLTKDTAGLISHAEIRLRSEKQRYWNSTPNGTCNFRYSATHEIGHALGLNHTCLQSAVLYYRDNAVSTLTSDDKNAHRWAYTSWGGPPGPDPVQC